MDKKEFVEKIQQEISIGQKILADFNRLQGISDDFGNGAALIVGRPKTYYDPNQQYDLTNKITLWERRVRDILSAFFGVSGESPISEFKLSDVHAWFDFKKSGVLMLQKNLLTLHSYIDRIDFFTPLTETVASSKLDNEKPFKIFISHSGEDTDFVNELVGLLEFLGADTTDKLFCSSIPGYQIPTSKDFAEYILKQFYDYRLFVIIVHSNSYYASSYCLNEMGAAWVLKSDFYSFLIKGFDYNDMDGVINNRRISVKIGADDAKSRLNELKDKIVSIFKPGGVNENRWEVLRDNFLKKVRELPDNVLKDEQIPLSTAYLKIFDRIFNMIDIDDYRHWTFYWAMAGDSKISVDRYLQLENLRDYLESLYLPSGDRGFNLLLQNLELLLNDYFKLCELHICVFDRNVYTIDRFYKHIPDNPEYHSLLREYEEYCFLICDMTLELTRLLNLILEKIRKSQPDYLLEKGILLIDQENRISVQYKISEKTESPYPGLKQFVVDRATRSKCLSKETNLSFVNNI